MCQDQHGGDIPSCFPQYTQPQFHKNMNLKTLSSSETRKHTKEKCFPVLWRELQQRKFLWDGCCETNTELVQRFFFISLAGQGKPQSHSFSSGQGLDNLSMHVCLLQRKWQRRSLWFGIFLSSIQIEIDYINMRKKIDLKTAIRYSLLALLLTSNTDGLTPPSVPQTAPHLISEVTSK